MAHKAEFQEYGGRCVYGMKINRDLSVRWNYRIKFVIYRLGWNLTKARKKSEGEE